MGEETERAYLDAIASSTGTDLSTLRNTFSLTKLNSSFIEQQPSELQPTFEKRGAH
jgi:hypothetical protein